MYNENFEIESRKVEFGIPVDMPGSDLTPEDLAPESEGVMVMEFKVPGCHETVRTGLPF